MVNRDGTYSRVLHVGPNYKKRKGGIASVLALYSETIPGFHFFPSAYFQNTFLNFLLLPLLLFLFTVKLYTASNSIRIVHIHGASKGSFYRKYFFFIIAKRGFGKTTVFHLHGGKFDTFYKKASPRLQKRIERLMLQTDCVIVLSKEWKRFVNQTFKTQKIQVLNNMINTREPLEKVLKKPIKLLFIGKISEEKGIWDLLETLNQNRTEFEGQLKIYIAGNGDVKTMLETIKNKRLSSLVTYLGWVSGSEKEAILTRTHVMLLPSYYEGLPVSLLEGMSYSMPLIASGVGGIPHILKNNVNGISITPGNIHQLAEALRAYVNNPEKIHEHGKASYERVTAFFPSRILPQLETIYAKIDKATC